VSRRDTIFDADAMRQTILDALPRELSVHAEPPEPRYLYVPFRHARALSPDQALVVGIRGSGKSVWWAALQSEAHRRVITASLPSAALEEISTVSAGFGEPNRPDDYPDQRTLRHLLAQGCAPADIWRTIIAWHTWGRPSQGGPGSLAEFAHWRDRVRWMSEHPEESAHAFKRRDDELATAGRKHLILFHALEYAANDWPPLRRLLRGLLETLLDFRSYRAIRAKAFVRPDTLDDAEVTAFRDASKITALRKDAEQPSALPPPHLDDGPEGLRTDLSDLGVLSITPDGRINMPDVYRVGFGLGRRGAVKPIR
jgi:hypothetical protein